MYQLKQLPEDFIVREISDAHSDFNGQYAYYILKKTGYTTIDAVIALSKKINIPLKNFGFAGNKDKNAVTEQKISIFRGRRGFESIRLKDIGLKYVSNGKEPVSLGDLEGNEFTITVRNLSIREIKKIQDKENKKINVPNLYGPQRFSKNNAIVGKAIVKRDFKIAVELVLKNCGTAEEEIRQYLTENKSNYIGALRLIPLKTRKLFIHSYQSFLFNKIIDGYLKNNNKNSAESIKIPLIGFNLELSSIKNIKIKKIFRKILEEEKLNPRDFITSQIPELASEGGFRKLFFELKFKILETGKDELSKNKQKIKINFTLPKSCYATVALESLFQ